MEDLSREEKIEQEVSRLEKRISELAIERKKEKWLRTKLTFFILSGFVFFIVLKWGVENDVKGLWGCLIFSPVITIAVMFMAYVILAYIINGVIKDTFAIGEMLGRQDAIKLSKCNNSLDEKTKELKKRIEYLEDYQEKLIEENVYLRLNEVKQNGKD